jgi:multidrug resistance efflux pump
MDLVDSDGDALSSLFVHGSSAEPSAAGTFACAAGEVTAEAAGPHAPRATAVTTPPRPYTAPPAQRGERPRFGWRPGAIIRRTIAIALVVAAVWWLVVPLLFPITSDAVVNARLVQVRAPIDGMTAELCRQLGETVYAGEPLVRLVNARVDAAHLSVLKTRNAEVEARRDRLATELATVERSEAACRQTAAHHRDGRVAMLEARVKEFEAQVEAARAQYGNMKNQLVRTKTLTERHALTASDLESAFANEAVAQKRMAELEAGLAGTRTAMEAARKGIYLQNETPYLQQRAHELALKIPQLRASLREAEDLLATLRKEVAGEQQRIASLSEAAVTSPVTGLVWTCQGNLGQIVKQNETVYHIADSSTVFVEAMLHQRHLASLDPGSEVTILLTGGQVCQGQVRAARTPGPTDIDTGSAVKLASDMKQVRVLIDLEPGTARTELIGRHARVLVTPAGAGPLSRAVAWTFAWAGR